MLGRFVHGRDARGDRRGVQIMLTAATAILKKSAGVVEPRGHGGGLLMLERI
jgi:hypothetical protein